jgi:hypothetical protein
MLTLSQQMRGKLACAIPVWFAPDMPPQQMTELLSLTLADCELFMHPEHIALVVDGCCQAEAPTQAAAEQFAQRVGRPPLVLVKEKNEGQGGAVCFGLEHFLTQTDVPYLCSRDADGDHDIYDLPQMFRLLLEMQEAEGTDEVLVLGQRGSLHRPMGFARGEYERLLNEITLLAVRWAMAKNDTAPDLRYCQRLPEPPDFQSGYKLYTRSTAEAFVRSLRTADEQAPELKVLRWGIQFISTVDLLSRRAVAGSVYRLTYDQQPQSTFENADNRLVAYGQQFVWLYRRLQIPAEVGLRWWDEAILRTLWADTPGGWDELLAIRQHLGEELWPGTQLPPAPQRHVMF